MTLLIDIIEQWAIKKDWWYYKSYIECSVRNKQFINLRITKHINTGVTVYDDGEVTFLVPGGVQSVQLQPADPAFFDHIETHLNDQPIRYHRTLGR